VSSDPESTLWQQLVLAGLIADSVPLRLDGGNQDRNPQQARSSWLGVRKDGAKVKLTLGADLAGYVARASAFTRAFPELVPAIVFHCRIGNIDVLGEEFIDGRSLDELLSIEESNPERLAITASKIVSSLNAAARPSTEAARAEEWAAWQEALLALPCWTPVDRVFLETQLLPRLRTELFADSPTLRLIHGDFAGRNIFISTEGKGYVIDLEFAAETHFPMDAARFYALTPRVDRLERFLLQTLPRPSTASLLLFWLQQIQREVGANRAEYVSRWLPVRLAEIRRLGDLLAGAQLPGCPWPTATPANNASSEGPVKFHLEEARWLVDSSTYALQITGWCYPANLPAALSSVELLANDVLVASAQPQPRSDVRDHFKRAGAFNSGFTLQAPPVEPTTKLSLVAVLGSGDRHAFWEAQADQLPGRGPVLCGYKAWAQLFDPDPVDKSSSIQGAVRFSILLPVYNTDAAVLRTCVESVCTQHYAHWELVIVDDASSATHLSPLLQQFSENDQRIVCTHRATNGGIARATNDALGRATGDFIVLLDHDDVLRPHALARLAEAIEAERDLDAVYSDEDKIDAVGQRVHPMFKPGFSPEFLRGVMYIGHVLCVRTAVAKSVGGFDPEFDGVQDYEFMLRVSETTRRTGHVARVLYHWRQLPGSSALSGNVKGDMDRKQLAAVAGHLKRSGQHWRRAQALGGHRIRLLATETFSADVITVRYKRHEDVVAALRSASRTTSAEFLFLVGEGCPEPTRSDQLELAALARLADSGCVAPVLIGERSQVIESGRFHTSHGSQPAMQGFDLAGDGYNGSLLCNREVSIVSPACVMIRRALVAELAGSVNSWNAFCDQLTQTGKLHRVCAHVRLSVQMPLPAESNSLVTASPVTDRYYNPHFDTNGRDFWLARRPPHLPRVSDPIVAQLETDLRRQEKAGCFDLRGWAFHLDGQPLTARIVVGPLELTASVNEPRPDVKEVYPVLTDGLCGWSARLRVPNGVHPFTIEAVAQNGDRQKLFEGEVTVTHSTAFSRWRHASGAELLRFQLFAGYAEPARKIVPERFPPASGSGARRPRLSIMTPSFQQARFLRATMESVLNGTLDREYVVQDGGSKDGSLELIQTHASALSAWSSEPDNGQADAIAKGFAKTSGQPDDVMAWINSDDFYLPGALGYVADYFAQHPDVDVIYGHRVLVDEDSQEIGRWFLPEHDDEVLKLNDFVPQETVFWRRRIWDKVGGIDTSFSFAMDWDLLLRFQAAGAKIVRVSYFLACFRIHSAQKTSAQMRSVGQKEIDALRRRTFGRVLPAEEIENHPRLISYLRKSAWIEFLWRRLRIRHR
jgi:glycosyltransferase involved in cell wall biosynthesis